MEEESFCGLTVDNMLAIGYLGNKKVMVLIICLINKQNMVFGRMGREHNG